MANFHTSAPATAAPSVIFHGAKTSTRFGAFRSDGIHSQGRTITKQQNTDIHWPIVTLRCIFASDAAYGSRCVGMQIDHAADRAQSVQRDHVQDRRARAELLLGAGEQNARLLGGCLAGIVEPRDGVGEDALAVERPGRERNAALLGALELALVRLVAVLLLAPFLSQPNNLPRRTKRFAEATVTAPRLACRKSGCASKTSVSRSMSIALGRRLRS